MPTNISDIPKEQSLTALSIAIIEEGETLLKSLDYAITRLKTLKNELLKLK